MKRLFAAFLILSLAFSLIGCKASSAKKREPAEIITSDELDQKLKSSEEFQLVENGKNLELFVNGKTAELLIKDKNSGISWYSNPPEKQSDEIAVGENKEALFAQLSLEYFDENNRVGELNSYIDCLTEGQADYAKIENGLRVTYLIGKQKKIYVIPKIISAKRLNDLILSKLSEDDQKEVLNRYTKYDLTGASAARREDILSVYPQAEDGPIYVILPQMAEFAKQKLENIILSSGYTAGEMEQDDIQNNIEPEEQPPSFRISVDYTISDTDFNALIHTDSIISSGKNVLTDIRVLPFFGAAGLNDEGYMLVPDGSGAIIGLNNGKTDSVQYKHPVYGRDTTVDQLSYNEVQTNLPVFGMKHQSKAYLAIIESGASIATVNANISGIFNSYNNIFSSFALTQFTEMTAAYQDSGKIRMYQSEPFPDDLIIRYCLLGATDYIGMAQKYQQYLTDRGELNKADDLSASLKLELIGTVDYSGSFLGIPVTKYKKLTSFDEAAEIIDALNEKGAENISLTFDGWAKRGIKNSLMTAAKPESALGGENKLNDLLAKLSEENIASYYQFDVQKFYKDSAFNEYRSIWDAPKNILGEIVNLPVYNFANGLRQGWNLLTKPANYKAYTEKGIGNLSKINIKGVSIPSMGSVLYSDFSKNNYVSREAAARFAGDSLKSIQKDDIKISLKSPNVYSLSFADEITELPEKSNQFHLVDRDVPFFQAVLHGSIPYSHPSLNQSPDYQTAALKAVEYGANPSMKWMYAPNKDVKGILENGYSLHYGEWLEKAAALYARISEMSENISDSKISGHEMMGDRLYKTTFENGYAVFVNYADTDAEINGKVVPAKDFVLYKEGA